MNLLIFLLLCAQAFAFNDGYVDLTTYNEPAMMLNEMPFTVNSSILGYMETYDFDFKEIDPGKWSMALDVDKHIDLVMSLALEIDAGVEVKLSQVSATEYVMQSSEPVKLSMAYGVYQAEFSNIKFQYNDGYMKIVESDITGYLGEFLSRSEGWQL